MVDISIGHKNAARLHRKMTWIYRIVFLKAALRKDEKQLKLKVEMSWTEWRIP